MVNVCDIQVMKPLLGAHGFHFSKSMGQNFLTAAWVPSDIADASGADAHTGVLEVGPGIGVLTYELSQVSKKVVTIELDKRLLPVLDETLADCDNVKVINDDVMKIDLHRVIEEEFNGEEVAVCANLPYYITSPVIMKLLEDRLPITSITVMVQKEAAERLCAQPGTRECGAVSAAVQYYAEPEILFEVSRGSFMPAPNVDSAVIQLRIRKESPVDVHDEVLFFRVIRAAFAQRRKTLVNTVSNTADIEKERIKKALNTLGISETARSEQLTLAELAELSNLLGGR